MLRAVEKTLTLPALLIALAGIALAGFAMTAPALAEPADFGFGFEPRAFPSPTEPLLPPLTTFPVQLVLDDDGAEGVFGSLGFTARQFLWFNRFANPGPFVLEEIWVLFPSSMDVSVGGAVQLVVYLDSDGDPATGAMLLATYDETIQAADDSTFSVYTLPTPLEIANPGDVLIGVVNRYFSGPPPTLPAALDTTVSQDRSYFALWPGDAPDPPDLATATLVDVLDGVDAGNFMIRGFGRSLSVLEIPTLGGAGLALLAAVLGLAGAALTRRRKG